MGKVRLLLRIALFVAVLCPAEIACGKVKLLRKCSPEQIAECHPESKEHPYEE
jgi:hypothetical protein